jgi:hypothetical protein
VFKLSPAPLPPPKQSAPRPKVAAAELQNGAEAMDIQTHTAVVFIDPQNDVLSEKGANWGAVGASVTENRTVENMERIFEAAKRSGYEVFISQDATAGPRHPVWGDGYQAAIINYRFLAHRACSVVDR